MGVGVGVQSCSHVLYSATRTSELCPASSAHFCATAAPTSSASKITPRGEAAQVAREMDSDRAHRGDSPEETRGAGLERDAWPCR